MGLALGLATGRTRSSLGGDVRVSTGAVQGEHRALLPARAVAHLIGASGRFHSLGRLLYRISSVAFAALSFVLAASVIRRPSTLQPASPCTAALVRCCVPCRRRPKKSSPPSSSS